MDVATRLADGTIRARTEDRLLVWEFFSASSWAVMAVMMAGGFALRSLRLVPDEIIAFVYSATANAVMEAKQGLYLKQFIWLGIAILTGFYFLYLAALSWADRGVTGPASHVAIPSPAPAPPRESPC